MLVCLSGPMPTLKPVKSLPPPSTSNLSANAPVFDTTSRYIKVFYTVTFEGGRIGEFNINVKGNISAPSLRSKMNTSLGKGDHTIRISRFDDIIDPLLCEVRVGHLRTRNIGGGLINITGNACFMNAALQSLFYLPVVFNYLQSNTVRQHTLTCTRQLCTLCPLLSALQGTLSCSPIKPSVRPDLMHDKLKVICSTMEFGRQEDSHEFLM